MFTPNTQNSIFVSYGFNNFFIINKSIKNERFLSQPEPVGNAHCRNKSCFVFTACLLFYAIGGGW